MLDHYSAGSPLDALTPVTDPEQVAKAITAIGRVHASEPVRRYIVELIRATRTSPELRLGASPRAGLQLLRTARARAAMDGRAHILPDDVQALAVPVLDHRILLSSQGRLSRGSTVEALQAILARVGP
ncbi:AAA family ATPase [Mobilicoccus caccae]|uniref:ChlI/MoxR AAA lid domain-containing protein n=1 Tax=Mobilicoccus caccae TaxID=1859295 RepID=A0ABQ6IRJ0_9MICO|nr:hypothetical protein GCM10025883_21010 [Mobilicoccus caccae]